MRVQIAGVPKLLGAGVMGITKMERHFGGFYAFQRIPYTAKGHGDRVGLRAFYRKKRMAWPITNFDSGQPILW